MALNGKSEKSSKQARYKVPSGMERRVPDHLEMVGK